MPHPVCVSAVVITFNEEKNIDRCLLSLKDLVDEIVVVDSFSTDRTAEICARYGVKWIQHPFEGHIQQKNRALDQATYDIILSLDADEALDETLRQSILNVKANWQSDGYSMNRKANYCGQWIHHSGWYPDVKTRLFDRRKARWGGVNPHDRIEMAPGSGVAHLRGDLLHYSYYTQTEHFERAQKYARIAAEAMYQDGRKGTWWKLVFSPIFKFLRNYLFRLGFLDGEAGYTICRISALETYWKYRNLRALTRQRNV